MVASVPELTIRTFSILGKNALIFSAMVTSIAVGAPKLRPFSAALITASLTAWLLWPRIIGPHEPT